MTRVDDRTRASPSRARARPRARPDGRAKGLLCTSHLVMRSPRTRVAPALTRALPPSRNRVFTGRHLRLYRQDRDRAHRARQAPHPDPGCQPQGAPPPQLRTKRRTEKPRLPAFEPIAPSRSRDRARDARRGAKRARDAREEHVPRSRAHTCPSRSAPPPRKDGGDAFPSRPRASGVFARATWRSRGRYLVIFRASEPVSKKVFFARFRKKFFH